MNNVLILHQSKSVRKSLCEFIKIEGYNVLGIETPQLAEEAIIEAIAHRAPFDLLIYEGDTESLTGALATIPFIYISSEPSIANAMALARRGALDYLVRPLDMNRLLSAIRNALRQIEEQIPESQPQRSATRRRTKPCNQQPMVGISQKVERLRHLIEKIAPSDARVMILGENGTGKELVAHCIHTQSSRAEGPFVEVNCAAIPSELIESELFGHEKGAFTSAIKQRHGKFEQADGGTLFLDEIGDMSLSAQAKVLRALQERKICRVGSDKDIDVDVRVIAATNKDIRAEIKAGNFREDLYHRIGVIVLNVVALRERREDIPILIDYFLSNICEEYHIEKKTITSEAIELLKAMDWSGNIRELKNVVERLIVLSDNSIKADDVMAYC